MNSTTTTTLPVTHTITDIERARGQRVFYWANAIFLVGTGLLALLQLATL